MNRTIWTPALSRAILLLLALLVAAPSGGVEAQVAEPTSTRVLDPCPGYLSHPTGGRRW